MIIMLICYTLIVLFGTFEQALELKTASLVDQQSSAHKEKNDREDGYGSDVPIIWVAIQNLWWLAIKFRL